MKHPLSWNRSDLHHHLQHALNVELWTIPLYLTALYSIRDLKKLKHNDYPEAAKLILSVVVQEMLHMELVVNISSALGCSLKLDHPNYDEKKGIPFPTALLGEYILTDHSSPAVILYDSTLAFQAIAWILISRVALKNQLP